MSHHIAKESLGELVAEQLRRSIWNREFEFGERLIESDLSEKFDVSRNTIRDALKILEYEEMVISKPRKGTYVSQFSKNDWQEIIELRSMVESFAFVKALPYLEEQHFQDLETILEQMKVQTENQNWSDLFDLDMKFHRYVLNMSGNSRVIKLYDSIQVQIRTFLLHLDKYYSSHQSFYDEQKELLDALKTKNPKIVDEKIRTHIEYVEGQFLGDVE
ncbi:GntR family transcriptional regulator [Pseudogracilibacillus auburnensis]|uniref:DNA-binding GntR family transcriptional regulator n=1 Tax=Pseudogracilibacillus auburnensis TaxID=1494959 RepID=A0A2V3VZN4_9BACI|nr:GntR family transcriptional regulator [Pseudogracilibacillus auburnensis]MBO1002991.1 GntR family transcriptional regulator [Pseudogracilibacillus auburnensis]PXW87090.1 DNA-binding GntR family transcriptional regulator [Pseudogracilibacillus auburnensis]